MKLICPDCGMQYESGKFCQECGTKLKEAVTELVCLSCGYKAKSGNFCPECGTKLAEEICASTTGSNETVVEGKFNGNDECFVKHSLPMDDIRRDANAIYPKQSLKTLAVAALKIAEVIQERLPEEEVSYMVHPSVFAPSTRQDALPIHFLFKKNGVPKVAVVAVTENGYRTPKVIATQLACDFNNVEYVRVYADGSYADWMEDGANPDTVEFCKNWLVQKIRKNL